MSGSGGYGSGPYGGGPYGSSASAPLVSPFDIYCFEHCSPMLNILSAPAVSTIGDASQFVEDYPNGPGGPNISCDLGILSGDVADPTFFTTNAVLSISVGVPNKFTFEWTVLFEELPSDFTDLINNHVGFFTTDSVGPCAGLFIAQNGIAYAGGVHHSGGNLVLDGPLQVIPGSSSLVALNEYTTIRIAADSGIGAVYVFVTPSSEIPVTGHRLVAILPLIEAGDLAFPPVDRSFVTVRGTTTSPSRISLDAICLASAVVIPNVAPSADAGEDQAARICSIVQLDGRNSFDPEGAPVTYYWRLIDAPVGSSFSVEGNDGRTFPIDASGFTDKFHSPTTLAAIDLIDPILVADVLVVQGVTRTVVATGTDANGYFLLFADQDVPDNLGVNEPFKVLRQRAINGETTAQPTFFPDIPGFYRFDLVVSDGSLLSTISTVTVNVLESLLPRGCTPNLSFIFNFLGDFWSLVEDRDSIPVFWSALAQVAATELYTLWQIEYSKSIRDIQRQFVRRWLHYDTLLAEPLPELTKIRAIWGGVESEPIPPAGLLNSNNSHLDISSPIFDAVKLVVFKNPNGLATQTLTPAQFEAQLRLRLSAIDSRFKVERFTNRVTNNEVIRIDAPFPFTIDASSTTPVGLFTAGESNGKASDTSGGLAIGFGAYLTTKSLQGLDIQEDDFIVLNGVALRISRVVDVVTDEFPFQRVVIKDDFEIPASSAWDISGYVSSELIDFYNGLVTKNDAVYFDVADLTGVTASTIAEGQLLKTTALGASSVYTSRLPFDPLPIGEFLARSDITVRFAKIIRRTHVPVDDLIQDIPTLTEKIVIETEGDEQAVLRRNLDFFIEEFRGHNSIRFQSGNSPDVWEGQDPPNRLWAEYTFLDNRPTIEENFGIPVDFTLDTLANLVEDVDYLSAVRGLWYSYINGPTLYNLRVGTQILLGLPFAEVPGIIEEIRTDFSPAKGRILIRDKDDTAVVRSYEFPRILDLETNPSTGLLYEVDDQVKQFAPLVHGAEVIDYVKNPKWFEGYLNQGVFSEVEKFHKFLVTVDSSAFNLSTLLFVRDFILKIKPTYTYPLIVVVVDTADVELTVTDDIVNSVNLLLFDSPCRHDGLAYMLDEYRSAGGGIRNQLDTDGDPLTAPPTFPTPQAVEFGLDRGYLCPESIITAICCMMFTGAGPFGNGHPFVLDSCFSLDTAAEPNYKFLHTSIASVPAGPAGLTLTPSPITINDSGKITKVRLVIAGNPGVDPTNYELVIQINAADTNVLAFTATAPAIDASFSISTPVVATDTITARIRPASGGARSPNWSSVRVSAIQEGAAAVGTLTLTGNAGNGQTVTIGTKVYTFQTTLTDVDGNVLIGATASNSIDNLIAAINLAAGAGTLYAASTAFNQFVTAVAGTGDTMDVTARSPGTSGNTIATTETLSSGSWGGATLSGGNGVTLFLDMGGDPVGPPPAPPGLNAGIYCNEVEIAAA